MVFYLFLLFAVMPIVEIYVLIQVGNAFGAMTTIALVLLTAAVGASLVRSQGLSTMMNVQQRLNQGELPGQQIVEAMLLAVAGVLLVTPGFVTDLFGLLILTPATRAPIARYLMARMQLRVVHGGGMGAGFGGGFGAGPQQPPFGDDRQSPFGDDPHRGGGSQNGQTIDGDYERKE
ncbi:FxsA family protein [Ferrimonas marina]|uniref:UPF0716 protein FxsA n=1 Tax=Ferrimonas marina TaxID=299255 RepID=A0A1M5XAT2_9GAMM|nr:FxsA family protein [Ferrimonas marina]SHH96975.1 UPF0716 protein FxsA [Ferrimonas marina]